MCSFVKWVSWTAKIPIFWSRVSWFIWSHLSLVEDEAPPFMFRVPKVKPPWPGSDVISSDRAKF